MRERRREWSIDVGNLGIKVPGTTIFNANEFFNCFSVARLLHRCYDTYDLIASVSALVAYLALETVARKRGNFKTVWLVRLIKRLHLLVVLRCVASFRGNIHDHHYLTPAACFA